MRLDDNPRIPIAALDLAALRRGVGPVEAVPGTRDHNAVIVDPGDHRRHVWVRPSYTDYRAAWALVHVRIAPGMQVDHVYNRARALVTGYEYVRLFLCPSDTNRRHGSFIERRLTRIAHTAVPLVPSQQLLFASNWTIAKMAGIAIDRSNPTYNQSAALEWLRENNFY